ncbi:hypothetical protein KAI87_11495 [Myxococcota bacterium]|nr:hypothetical protein [Myxococcota bacterium]
MSQNTINPSNTLRTNWANALEGDNNVTPKEAQTIIDTALEGGIGRDDMEVAYYLISFGHRASIGPESEHEKVVAGIYDFSGKDSAKSGIKIGQAIYENRPTSEQQLYNDVARNHPILAKLAKPFFAIRVALENSPLFFHGIK